MFDEIFYILGEVDKNAKETIYAEAKKAVLDLSQMEVIAPCELGGENVYSRRVSR